MTVRFDLREILSARRCFAFAEKSWITFYIKSTAYSYEIAVSMLGFRSSEIILEKITVFFRLFFFYLPLSQPY